jgi:hypothetical protein
MPVRIKKIIMTAEMAHPSARPAARCRPDLVKGIPICLESLAFAVDIPKARFQEKEKPYFFILTYPNQYRNVVSYPPKTPKISR